MVQIIVTIIICIVVTILLNKYFREKYKTEYDKFYKREKEFDIYRDNELAKIKSETEELHKLRMELLNQSTFLKYAQNSLTLRHIVTHDCLGYNRFYHFIRDEYKNVRHEIKTMVVKAEIQGKDSKTYNTTLDACDCYDFKNTLRGEEPCKHMYMLAYELALLNTLPYESIKKELGEATDKYLRAIQELKKLKSSSK